MVHVTKWTKGVRDRRVQNEQTFVSVCPVNWPALHTIFPCIITAVVCASEHVLN